VRIERGSFELKERKTSQENGDEILAEIAFINIEYVLENSSHATVTKVLLYKFTIQCPQHKNLPFSLLVSSLHYIQIKRHTLLVRHHSERIRKDIQLLAPSGSSVPHCAVPKIPAEQNAAESVTEEFKQFLSKYSFQTVHPIAMNWELDVFSSEALLVKTPDTPECVPAIIDHLKISRVGPSKDKIKYELTGRLSFASFM